MLDDLFGYLARFAVFIFLHTHPRIDGETGRSRISVCVQIILFFTSLLWAVPSIYGILWNDMHLDEQDLYGMPKAFLFLRIIVHVTLVMDVELLFFKLLILRHCCHASCDTGRCDDVCTWEHDPENITCFKKKCDTCFSSKIHIVTCVSCAYFLMISIMAGVSTTTSVVYHSKYNYTGGETDCFYGPEPAHFENGEECVIPIISTWITLILHIFMFGFMICICRCPHVCNV